jgi:hypothetical protein
MSAQKNNHSPGKGTYTALGLAIGLIFGSILGFVTGNMIIFTGGGLLLGLSIGAALEKRNRKGKS